jgi:molybdenum cofactor synthesis domain-containing protein
LAAYLRDHGWPVERTAVVPDDQTGIESQLVTWSADHLDLILTTGGTGFSPRDLTPEATAAVCDRMAPGLAEAMRQAGSAKTPHAMLSRAVAGMRGRTLIVNLPGSPQGAVESLQVVLPALEHGLRLLRDEPAAEMGHHHA